jgi:hypothetical protein
MADVTIRPATKKAHLTVRLDEASMPCDLVFVDPTGKLEQRPVFLVATDLSGHDFTGCFTK